MLELIAFYRNSTRQFNSVFVDPLDIEYGAQGCAKSDRPASIDAPRLVATAPFHQARTIPAR